MATFGDPQAINLANCAQLTANGYSAGAMVTNDAWAMLIPTPANCTSITQMTIRALSSAGANGEQSKRAEGLTWFDIKLTFCLLLPPQYVGMVIDLQQKL